MQIAAEHPEAEGQGAGPRVEEGLLLDRIALDATHVAPRHAQVAAAIDPHFADADGAVRNRTFVPASVTADAIPGDRFDEFRRRLCRSRLEYVSKRGHTAIVRSRSGIRDPGSGMRGPGSRMRELAIFRIADPGSRITDPGMLHSRLQSSNVESRRRHRCLE